MNWWTNLRLQLPKLLRNNGESIPYAVWLNDCVRSQQRIVEFDEKMAFADAEECMDLVDQLISLGLIADEIFFSMNFCKLRRRCNFFRFFTDLEHLLPGFEMASFFFDQIQKRTCTFLLMCNNKKTRNGSQVRNNIKHFRWGTPHDIKEPSGYKTSKTSHNFSTPSWPCPPRGQSSQPRECLGRASGVGLNSQRWQPSIGTKLCIYI